MRSNIDLTQFSCSVRAVFEGGFDDAVIRSAVGFMVILCPPVCVSVNRPAGQVKVVQIAGGKTDFGSWRHVETLLSLNQKISMK